MARDRKPIPKNQSQITQEALNPPYLPEIGKPVSDTVFTQERALQLTRKKDKIKDDEEREERRKMAKEWLSE